MLIYVDAPFRREHKDELLAGAGGHTFLFKDELEGEQQQLAALLKADILLGNPKPVEWLQQANNLLWIQLYSTGFEYYKHIRLPAVITNMQDYYAQPCAETAIAGILALYRGMDDFAVLKSERKWVGYPIRAELQLLQYKKVFILGTGHIGKRAARILSGFDCKVTFYGRSADAQMKTPQQLEAALPDADIVIACLPGTEETKGLFTSAMIRRLKPTAVFCNVGRGNLPEDEMVLVEALVQRRIGGAVLDVTAEEPIPAGHPLWNCPNTILSQHSGGGNITEYSGIVQLFL